VDNEVDLALTYISIDQSTAGDFKFHYSVNQDFDEVWPLRKRVDLLKQLSKTENTEILSTDDEIDPLSQVLIEPNGQTSTIHVVPMAANEVFLANTFNFPFGDFRTKRPITDEERQTLIELIKPIYPNIIIWYGDDGPIINGEFNKVKSAFGILSNFNHHYEVTPTGKNEWLDRTEKSLLFISIMREYKELIKSELCIFPRNFSEIAYTEGGSDSEEHCIVLIGAREEKIIYKKR